ncbi:protein DA1 [Dactylosporangium darangshiense]|uniref:protein DA1 n=1 Tax=Dactylosporangium darangshiense TaxID=579108 RepID=UPI00363589AC
MCELFAYAWLKQHGSPLARALREQFASNPDPVYGAGFRAVYAAVRAHGIDTVLDGVLLTGRLP